MKIICYTALRVNILQRCFLCLDCHQIALLTSKVSCRQLSFCHFDLSCLLLLSPRLRLLCCLQLRLLFAQGGSTQTRLHVHLPSICAQHAGASCLNLSLVLLSHGGWDGEMSIAEWCCQIDIPDTIAPLLLQLRCPSCDVRSLCGV